jgi:hypothetical protein
MIWGWQGNSERSDFDDPVSEIWLCKIQALPNGLNTLSRQSAAQTIRSQSISLERRAVRQWPCATPRRHVRACRQKQTTERLGRRLAYDALQGCMGWMWRRDVRPSSDSENAKEKARGGFLRAGL